MADSKTPKNPKKVNEVGGLRADADHWAAAATKGPDDIYGADADDHLYGGPGNDTLHGGGGDYYIESGDCKDGSRDRIEDKIDDNMVIFDNIPLPGFIGKKDGSGSLNKYEYKYQPPFSKADSNPKPIEFVGAYSGNDSIVANTNTGGTVILNENFQSGDFGTKLYDELTSPDNPETDNEIQGDQNSENLNDTLTDTSGNDVILGGAGDDFIYSDSGGQDWLKGGEGCDLIDGLVSTNTIIEGGAGSDALFGSYAGGSQIFGDSYGDMQTLIDAGETAEGTGQKGDYIAAGYPGGDNFLYGSNGKTALMSTAAST